MIHYTDFLKWPKETPFLQTDCDGLKKRIEKKLPTYEVITNDSTPKLYFDVDYKMPKEDYCVDIAERVENISRKYLMDALEGLLGVHPDISTGISHSPDIGEGLGKYSVRFWVNNIRAKKSIILNFVSDINKFILNDMKDESFGSTWIYDGWIDPVRNEGKLFDEGIYDSNRKMRCVATSKPNQNRPLLLQNGTIESTIITGFYPEDCITMSYKKKYDTKTKAKTAEKKTDNMKMYDVLLENIITNKGHDRKTWLCLTGWFFANYTREAYLNFVEPVWKEQAERMYDSFNEKKVKLIWIENLAKKLNAEKYEAWAEEYKPVIVAEDDNQAGKIIYNDLNDSIFYHKGQFFNKVGNIWYNNQEYIESYILKYIQDKDIKKAVIKKDGETKHMAYSANISSAENIKKSFYNILKTEQLGSQQKYNDFHATTRNRLCFEDGVLDFATQKFHDWKDVDFEYYSTVMIPRKYKPYFENPDLQMVKTVREKIFETMFGENTDKALIFFARAITGNVEDKKWMAYLGNRNCGKGVLYDALNYAFTGYVSTINLGNLMYVRKSANDSQECSKKLYWAMDLEFSRLAISQEIPDPKTGMKMNGELLKKLAGGGDTIIARRNFDRVDTHFNIDATFAFFGNNSIETDTPDVWSECVEMSSVSQFKTLQEIDDERKAGADEDILRRYRLKDTTIKDKVKTLPYSDALVYLLYQSWKDTGVVVFRDLDDENTQNILEKIKEHFTFTGDNTPITAKEVYQIINEDKKKIDNELKAMNIFKKKHKGSGQYRDKPCFYGLKKINTDADPETMNEV